MKNESTLRQALDWWNSLKSNIQLNHWRNYQKITFTPSHSPDDLTNREIEEIWLKENVTPISLTPSKLEILVEFACSVYDKNYNTDMSFRKRSETMVNEYLKNKL